MTVFCNFWYKEPGALRFGFLDPRWGLVLCYYASRHYLLARVAGRSFHIMPRRIYREVYGGELYRILRRVAI